MALSDWFADADTVFLSASLGDPNNWTALADDLSSNDDDLDNVASNHADDTTHTATDGLTGDRCVEALVSIITGSGTAAVICAKTDDTWRRWTLFTTSGDNLRIQISDGSSHTNIVDVAPPNATTTLQLYWVAWSDEANPSTTGASDARLSTLRVWQIDSEGTILDYDDGSGTHAEHAYDPSIFVVGANTSGGNGPWEVAGHEMQLVRISSRPRSRQEIEAYIPAVLAEFPKQGHVWAAKQGGLFFGIRSHDQSFSVLAADRSQNGTDLTAGTTWVYETSASRVVTTPRTVALLMDHDESTDTGVLFNHDIASERIRFTAADTIQVSYGGGSIFSKAIPFLDTAGTDVHRLLVALVTMVNPDTSGASDAEISFLLVANDNGEAFRASATHAVTTGGTGTTVFFANSVGGGLAYSGEPLAASVAGRIQTLAELYQDFLVYASEQTEGDTETLRQPLPLTEASSAGNQGELVGLAPQWIGLNHRKAIRRHFSPIVNERFWQPETMSRWSSLSATLQQHGVEAPGDSDYHIMTWWLFKRPVPPAANAAYVQVHVKQYDVNVAGGTFQLDLRLYTMNRRPGEAGDLKYGFAEASRTADDTSSGIGIYVFETVMPLVRAADGFTVIALAFAATHADLRFEINAIHVNPVFLDTEQGGGGIGGFGGG